ncbi:MAG: hypothetical protein WBG65_03925, partial [Sulfurimonadaceae bacterium]
MHNIKNLTIVLFLLFTFTGCSMKEIKSEGLTPKEFTSDNKYSSTVTVIVDGGRDKDPLEIEEVSNSDLLGAVKSSIKSSKIFSEVVDENADYTLE